MTTQNQIEKINIASSGANSDITSMTGLTGTLQAPTGVKSSAGVNLLGFSYIASAVNYIGFLNNTTGANPAIFALGTDGNITLQVSGKGTGGVYLSGTGTNDNAANGQVGEFISSVIPNGTPVTVANGTAVNITSINLTAGDWDVRGNLNLASGATTTTGFLGWTSTSSATIPDASLITGFNFVSTLSNNCGFTVPTTRYSLSTTTTIYITGFTSSVSGSTTVSGGIYARRVR